MADILSLDEIASLKGVLTPEEWKELGVLASEPDEGLKKALLGTFSEEKLGQLRDRAAAAAASAPAPLPEVEGVRLSHYDFRHPARVNKSQLRTLENLHDSFARLLSATLSSAMRQIVDVDTAFVDQTTYREYILSLSNPASSYEFNLSPKHGRAIMDIAMPVSFALVDRVHGGTGAPGTAARQLSQAEMGVLARVVKRAVEDLEATWEPVFPEIDICDIELETNPEFMQITAGSEIVILLAFEVNAPNVTGLISLCYPFFTLEPILPRLGMQAYARQQRGDREATRAANRLRLGGMPLSAVVELGRVDVPAAQAAALQVGDVVRLPRRTEDPACLFIGGRPKFLGHPCAGPDGRLQLQVAGRVPPQLASRYGAVDEVQTARVGTVARGGS